MVLMRPPASSHPASDPGPDALSSSVPHALVIGAGLAGAACTVNLLRRGWRVTLLDAASGPAAGASGLPVGMLSPHVTRVPTPLSRLCALGVDDALAELARSVPAGAGWQSTEVDNLGHDPGRWPAALVRPAAMVSAWLAEAASSGRLASCWNARVARLAPTQVGWWQALDERAQPLAEAPSAVVASAFGTKALLQSGLTQDDCSLPIRPVQGQLSFAPLAGHALAERPMRNKGVFVPRYDDTAQSPDLPSSLWAMGSTYERGREDTGINVHAHERNAQSLDLMLPQAARRLRECLAQGSLLGWAQVRCASLDRLPMVGAVPDVPALHREMQAAGHRRGRFPLDQVPRLPGLYMLAALGSRGLTLSHWCGVWLAAAMSGGTDPLPAADRDLRAAFDPARFAWKSARRQGSGVSATAQTSGSAPPAEAVAPPAR